MADDLNLSAERRQIFFDLTATFFCKNFEITEFASFSAERDMQIETEGQIGRLLLHDCLYLTYVFPTPLRKRWIVGNEVAANICFCTLGCHQLSFAVPVAKNLLLLFVFSAETVEHTIVVADDQTTICNRWRGCKAGAAVK